MIQIRKTAKIRVNTKFNISQSYNQQLRDREQEHIRKKVNYKVQIYNHVPSFSVTKNND
jgi:hypothetical protein